MRNPGGAMLAKLGDAANRHAERCGAVRRHGRVTRPWDGALTGRGDATATRPVPEFARKLRVNCAGIKTDRDFPMLIREMTLSAGAAAADAPEFRRWILDRNAPAQKAADQAARRGGAGFERDIAGLAIGLAVLDFTCFFAFEVRNAIPRMATAVFRAGDTGECGHTAGGAWQRRLGRRRIGSNRRGNRRYPSEPRRGRSIVLGRRRAQTRRNVLHQ